MTSVALLTDFGSTYTKLTAVDLGSGRIIGRTRVPTTVRTHLADGLAAGEAELAAQGVGTITKRLACSSAAGGLKMAVSGLMPELTVEAATRAALGAGAKVWRVFSHEMTNADAALLNESPPDIFLLTGGTDGGNKENILANAALLKKELTRRFPIVIAGNRVAADEAAALLADFNPLVCPNVMPSLGTLQVEPVQAAIRRIFLDHIVKAKGLDDVAASLEAPLIPTPAAVLTAVRLLAEGVGGKGGIGDLTAVDVGGATTDVYSIGQGLPSESNITPRGLPEPFAKRTVEGDIGMRYSCRGVVAAAGERFVKARVQLSDEALEAGLLQRESEAEWLPQTASDAALDKALAYSAMHTALRRHAGRLETVYTPLGQTFVQTGKDLRPFGHLVLTGGPLVGHADIAALAREALDNPGNALLPRRPQVLVDRNYVLSALGLLASWQPELALNMILKELNHE